MVHSSFLTQGNLLELKEAFSFFDKNGDGGISLQELGQIMHSLGHPVSEVELEEMMRSVDQNGDGIIDLTEFISLVNGQGNYDEELLEIFNTFDVNKDGVLSAEELFQALISLGEEVTESDARQILAAADLDGDGNMNFTEFTRIILSP
jgi:Ca2+-binding protein (EF-Hand superfamily)